MSECNILKSPLYAGFYFPILLWVMFTFQLVAQSEMSPGVIQLTSAQTGEPISFARVQCTNSGKGVYTDIYGKFKLSELGNCSALRISHINYVTLEFTPEASNRNITLLKMELKAGILESIEIRPEENPALRIMRNAIQNRKQNDFEHLPSYTCTAYNKVYIYPEALMPVENTPDTQSKKGKQDDSTLLQISAFADTMHLFLWENITERVYRKPGRLLETILASRTSGMKDMALPLSPTDIVDFNSFYKDWILVMGESYMGPLHTLALQKYNFELLETTLLESDTVFTISFKPSGKGYDGFEGRMHIHSGSYNIMYIDADLVVNAKEKFISGGHFEQLFQLHSDSVWFPHQLISEFKMSAGAMAQDLAEMLVMRIGAQVHIQDIQINDSTRVRISGTDKMITAQDATQKSDAYWSQYRKDTLSIKEQNTYRLIDSLGQKLRFDRWAYQLQKVAEGSIAWKFLDFELSRLLQYNLVEKLRTGAGIITNERVSSRFSVGAWGGYGWGDDVWKYGGMARLHPLKDKRWQLEFTYAYDLLESGNSMLVIPPVQQRMDLLGRNVRLRIMDYQTIRNLTFRNPVYRNWTQEVSLRQTDMYPGYDYLFQGKDVYYLNELIWEHRYAPGERYIRNGPFRMRVGSNLPVFQVRWTEGVALPDRTGYTYRLLEGSVRQTLNLHAYGKIMYAFQGGLMQGNIPYSRMHVFRGNFDRSWPLMSPMSFNTMPFNAFAADRYLLMHFRYDFNNLLFHSRSWHPNLLLEYNAGLGSLSRTSELQSVLPFTLTAPKHLYQEAGLVFQYLLPKEITRRAPSLNLLGLGFYYRIGAYATSEIPDNFAFKLYSGFRF
jgi:hypothetical protein